MTMAPALCGALLGVVAVLLPLQTLAASQSLLISQLQVAGAKADDEFIELYNPTDHETALEGWSLQYKSAAASKMLKKNFPAGASIPARGYYLIASADATLPITADMQHSSFAFAGEGGTVALVNATTLLGDFSSQSVVDKLGYGTATIAEGQAAPTPPAGQALERKPAGGLGNDIDTNNNASDFLLVAAHPRSRVTTPQPPPASEAAPAVSPPASESPPPSPPLPPPPAPPPPPPSPPPPAAPEPTTPPATQTTAIPPPAIILNEIVPDPGEGSAEWVELYFLSLIPASLDGATLEDARGTIATLSGAIGGNSPFFTHALSATRLNNSGDAVVLKWSDGTTLDRMTYGDENDGNISDNAPVPLKNQSLIRLPDGTKTGTDRTDWKLTTATTRGAANILTAPAPPTVAGSTPTVSDTKPEPLAARGVIRINEFVADPPDNGSEWVEIINTATQPFSLAGWVLEEGSGETTTLSGVIGTNEFDRFVMIINPKGALNNAGDRLVLRDPMGRIIDDVAYGNWGNTASANAPSAPDPLAVARIPESYTGRASKDFAPTTTPTPKSANRFPTPPSAPALPTPPASPIAAASTISSPSATPTINIPPTVILDAPDEVLQNETVLFDAEESFDPEGKPLTFTWEIEGLLTKTTSSNRLEYRFGSPGKFVLLLTVSDGMRKSKIRRRIKILPPETAQRKNEQEKQPEKKPEKRTPIKKSKTGVIRDGVVSAPFGILGARKFSAVPIGIIHVSRGVLPDLPLGLRIRVHGRLGDGQTETAFYVQEAGHIQTVNAGKPPQATAVAISDLTELSSGAVVRISGEVESARGKQVMMSEEGEQALLILPTKTKLSSRLFLEGDAIAATGILRKTSAGFAVVPRVAEDVQWLARAPAQPQTNQPKRASGLATSLVTASLGGILYGLWKLVPRKPSKLITFPELEEPKMLGEKPRPLLLDGTYPAPQEEPPSKPLRDKRSSYRIIE